MGSVTNIHLDKGVLMTKEYPYTFNQWMRGQCGEVKQVSLENPDLHYQSPYVYKFNYLRDRGWKRIAGRWVSPREPFTTYGDVHRAFGAQSLYEKFYEENEE